MNDIIIILQIVLFGLCVLGGIAVLIFALRKWDDGIDYNRIIRQLNKQEEKDLDMINKGNKQKDELKKNIGLKEKIEIQII